ACSASALSRAVRARRQLHDAAVEKAVLRTRWRARARARTRAALSRVDRARAVGNRGTAVRPIEPRRSRHHRAEYRGARRLPLRSGLPRLRARVRGAAEARRLADVLTGLPGPWFLGLGSWSVHGP